MFSVRSVAKNLPKDPIPERRALRDILKSLVELAVLTCFECDVSHGDHSHKVVIVVTHRNATDLLVSHLPNDVNDAIVRFCGVNINGHNVFRADARTILVICDTTHDDIAVSD